jgi:signal peptidase I
VATGQTGWLAALGELWFRLKRFNVIVVGVALTLLAFGLRGFVVEAFLMPSGSMFPTLEIQDHFFVLKAAYGVFTKSAPSRSDVVVFQYPEPNPAVERVDYVKRVIGLPNDTLEFESGAPVINGWHVPRCKLGTTTVTEAEGVSIDYQVFVEYLEGSAYLVALDRAHDEPHQGPYRVRAGEFWVVGDNRNNSSDSRSWAGGKGAGVPYELTKGRAWRLWFPSERFGIALHGPPVLPRRLMQLQASLDACLAKAPSREQSTPPSPGSAAASN